MKFILFPFATTFTVQNKREKISSLKFTRISFLFSFSLILIAVLSAFNIETNAYVEIYETGDPVIDTTMIIRTTQDPPQKNIPPPPPPTEPEVETVNPDDIVEPDLIDETIDPDDVIEPPSESISDIGTSDGIGQPIPPKPIDLPEITNKDDEEKEIYKVVASMPRFMSECETQGLNKNDLYICSKEAMLKYIYKHLKYPVIARENGIQGDVIIQFVVNEDGSISELNIARDIGAGCGAQAMNTVKNMPIWIPGMQQGRKVRVRYTLPIRFRLK